MLKNYFRTAIRNLVKSPLYSFLNIFSLAIGIAACMAIFIFISDESSFDQFHTKKDRLYRLNEVQTFTGTKPQHVALSMPGMAPAMLNDFPEVEAYTRFYGRGKQLYEKGDKKLLIEKTAMVDSTFFELFDYNLLAGDRETLLDVPHTIVLTRETALKFFESVEEAFGNTIIVSGRERNITGIVEVPEQSHLQFDALLGLVNITAGEESINNSWGSNYLNTYLLLSPKANIENMESRFDDFMISHMDNDEITEYYELYLQSLSDVHLGSTHVEHDYNNYRKFNGKYLDVFGLVGLFILVIAAVNFMNLSIARASSRWKEVGVRKSVGAQKNQLFLQFVGESVLMAVLALIISSVLVLVLLPLLNDLIDRPLSINILLTTPNLVVILLTTITLGALAGLYPSLYMSSFNTTKVLKGGDKKSGKSVLSNSLVILQFGLAIAMIVSTLIVLQQLNFMKNKDIGYDTEQMVLINMDRQSNENFDIIKDELLGSSRILGVTASGQRLGNNFHQWGFKVQLDTGIYNMTPSNVHVDYDYLKVYGIELRDGRGFSKDFSTDNGMAFVINEALVDELDLKNPVGTVAGHGWYNNDSLGQIIGVTENFNFNSLHHRVNTLALVVHADWGYDEMSVKIAPGDPAAAIAEIEAVWKNHVDWPFEYTFLDEHFAELYRSDQQMSAVVSIMAGLAILIACMGLFGLSAITTRRRVREIGIRKVLGASIRDIAFVLSGSFARMILIAFIIAAPITYFMLDDWLTNFAFRVNIGVLVFVIGGLLAFVIALGTLAYHIIRASLGNPVEALRVE